jgi:uncharacterized surface protein with fasciclin (FAS1) repeats
MTAMTPDTQALNFTHMYVFPDLKPKTRERVMVRCPEKSAMRYIQNNPKMSKFRKIIEKTDLDRFIEEAIDITLFVPLDEHLKYDDNFFEYMDRGMANQILRASMIDRRYDRCYLQSSPVSYYETMNPQMRLYVTNAGGKTVLNETVNIIKFDEEAFNGFIHIVDDLLIPNFSAPI